MVLYAVCSDFVSEDLSVLEEDLAHERQLNNVLTDEIARLTGKSFDIFMLDIENIDFCWYFTP